MEWQRLVADIGGEFDPRTGRPAFREIVCTVPRQSGKTTLLLSFELERCVLRSKPQRVVYSAQTGLDARRKLLEDQVPLIDRSPLRVLVSRLGRAQGSESVAFKSGSRIDLQASAKDSGHGRTVDLGIIDEAFADADDRREQSILPAMATRADGQLLVFSTAGDATSTYLRRKVDAGRAAALEGLTSGIAYFEWSADEDEDPDDPRTWWACMPALAGGTIVEETIRHARQTMADGEFRRAYLNQWTVVGERAIPEEMWRAVQGDAAPQGELFFGVDSTPEGTTSSIAVCDSAGRVELVANGPGTGWVEDRVVSLVAAHRGAVVVDIGGPLARLKETLELRGVAVHTVSLSYACGSFFEKLADRRITIRTRRELDLAAEGARRKPRGDAWVWARRDLAVDISPLVAVTLAVDRAVVPQAEREPLAAWI